VYSLVLDKTGDEEDGPFMGTERASRYAEEAKEEL